MSTRSRGSLMSLVATNHFNTEIKLRNVAYEYDTFDNINNSSHGPLFGEDTSQIKITYVADMLVPEYFEFTMKNDVIINNSSRAEFITELKKSTIKFYLGGSYGNYINFPLNLIINLNEPTYCDNKIYIKTCFNLFFGDLPLIAMTSEYHLLCFSLNNYNNLSQFIEKFGVLCELHYLDTEERRALAFNKLNILYQELSWIEFKMTNIRTNNNKYKFNIGFESVSKGFFIESDGINNLTEIAIHFEVPGNSQERIFLNKFLIQQKCVKISENMIYFPFNSRKSYTEISVESFEGGTNFSRIDDPKLLLKFSEPINNIKIYNVGSNLLMKKPDDRYFHMFRTTSFNNGLRDYESQRNSDAYYYWGGSKFNYIDPIVKQIGKNITCAITCEDIGIGAKYLSCHQCNNNFSEVEIKKWIEKKKTCPTCRVGWDNFQIYINGEAKSDKKNE
jgi:phage FluMu protein Com